MAAFIKYGTTLVGIALIALVGHTTYQYVFYTGTPTITLSGYQNGAYISGESRLGVSIEDRYKLSTITVYLDGKELAAQRCNKKSLRFEVPLSTTRMNPGAHIIRIDATTGAYSKASNSAQIELNIDNTPLQAAFVDRDAEVKVSQGRTIHVQFQANKQLASAQARIFAKTHTCFPEHEHSFIYECYVPVDCSEIPNEYLLYMQLTDHVGNNITLEKKVTVVASQFKRETLNLSADKVKTENESGASEKAFEQAVEILSAQSPHKKLWQGTFSIPVPKDPPFKITTEFGAIRVTQERGLRQHKALDIYHRPKSVVWAPQAGIVVMKERFAHSGNTLIIDHGWSVLSMLFHLDEFGELTIGDAVRMGDKVGTLGKTGYATGYHLHWEMRVNNIAVDPMQWTSADF